MTRILPALALLVAAAALAWAVGTRLSDLRAEEGGARVESAPVPVEVAPVERGAITLRRTFSGTLEAAAEFVVAPKVGGRVQSVLVDLGDPVTRGQVVATLDDAELAEAVKEAEAELAVARASRAEAARALELAERALHRAESLRADGVASESELDAILAQEVASRAHVEVTEATVLRAEAALEAARIRFGYARVTAGWSGGDDERVVAARFVDEGGPATANTPLLSIVELDPIVAVVHVPERDYARIRPGQPATLTTDTYGGATFPGRVARVAPVFQRSTRQARIELEVENGDERLKPGLFVRATLELERVERGTIVPFEALTEREGRPGLFVLDPEEGVVRWRPVEVGIREGARIQVEGDLSGDRVVTLGQELCDDGSRVSVVAGPGAPDDAGR